MPKLPYTKPAISIPNQVGILGQRGLVIGDAARVAHYLQFIGYYRLSGYSRYYADPSDEAKERFRHGTTFDQVLDLYIFDRKLRVLLTDALERIEVALKSVMSNECGLLGGPFWLGNPAHFDHNAHNVVLDIINDCIGEDYEISQHQFIKHFYSKYSDAHPPCWMIFEALSFGAVSHLYNKARGSMRLPVAAHFAMQHDVLASWLHALVFARNVCAHSGRVWNRRFTIQPKIPRQYRSDWPEQSRGRLYILCAIIHHLMKTVSDGSNWSVRLRQIIDERPNVPLAHMGFPDNWRASQFWGFE